MKKEKVANYVKTRNKKLFERSYKHLQVFIQSPLPDHIDIKSVFNEVEHLLPEHFLNLIDVVYIGDFPFFEERKINAMYQDGALYISNEQDDTSDIKDDIIHEIAHAVEDKYGSILYEDEEIQNEYFGKLKKLRNYLSFEGYDIKGINFFNISHDQQFDDFLLNDVGYEKLMGFVNGLFLAPYSVTSMREYFARGFEEFFLGDRDYLRKVCPYVFLKVNRLIRDPEELLYEYEM